MAMRRASRKTVLFLSMTLGLAAGCSSEDGGDDDGVADDGSDGADDGADGSDDGADDGADDGTGECDEEPCLEAPEQGFQVRSEGDIIAPGEDVEYCEVVVLPGTPEDTYYVNGFESEMTRGSHHLIVGAIVPGSPTDGRTEAGDKTSCIGPTAFGEDITDVTGQQVPEHSESFPAGVGRVYQGGQKLVFDYHYFNATDEDLQARAAVNFLTTDADQIEHISQGFGKLNLAIFIGPGEEGSFPTSCRMNRDVMVYKLTRHTHQWGTDFPVDFNDGVEGSEPQHIYTSPNYEDPDYIFEEPILVKEGQGFDFECNYFNDTKDPLTFGVNATDEMCILFGSMYSPTERELPAGTGCD
jgi:hypothetical protein